MSAEHRQPAPQEAHTRARDEWPEFLTLLRRAFKAMAEDDTPETRRRNYGKIVRWIEEREKPAA